MRALVLLCVLLAAFSAAWAVAGCAAFGGPIQQTAVSARQDIPLGLNETLALAARMSFNPVLGCWRSFLSYRDTSFLGPLRRLRTGPVLQAYYRFQRTDCGGGGTAPGERGGGSGGNELRRLLWLQRQRRRGGSWGASSTGGPEAALTAQQARQAQPPLMLVPGLGATMASWGADVLAELSCHREVILLENRGAGLSVDYAAGPANYYDMADSVVMLADALNLTRPDILGWSTGGNIGLILATLHAGRVGKVVGYGAMAGSANTVLPDWPDIFEPSSFNSLSLKQQMATLFPPTRPGFKDAVCDYIGSVFWMPRGTLQVNETVQRAQYEADVDFTTRDSQVWDALPSITTPVLLMAGEQDVLVPPLNSELIAQRIPGARLERFPSWGHAFQQGAREFVSKVVAFLDSSEEQRAAG